MSFLEGLTHAPRSHSDSVNPTARAAKADSSGGGFKVKGRTRFRVIGPDDDGNLVTRSQTPWIDNILTTYGLASLASAVGSSIAVTASNWIQAIYIGTSTTAAVSTDSKLGASTASLTMGNASFTRSALGAMTVEYQATFASSNTAGSYTIGEVGLYCNSTGNETQNNLAAHAILGTIVAKGASDVVQASYDIVFTTA